MFNIVCKVLVFLAIEGERLDPDFVDKQEPESGCLEWVVNELVFLGELSIRVDFLTHANNRIQNVLEIHND